MKGIYRGRHFENLALYEMVRRRCRLIVLSDEAGGDGQAAVRLIENAETCEDSGQRLCEDLWEDSTC